MTFWSRVRDRAERCDVAGGEVDVGRSPIEGTTRVSGFEAEQQADDDARRARFAKLGVTDPLDGLAARILETRNVGLAFDARVIEEALAVERAGGPRYPTLRADLKRAGVRLGDWDAELKKRRRAIADAAREEADGADDGGDTSGPSGDLPVILVGNDLHRVVDEAIESLSGCDQMYQRPGMGLTRIVIAPSVPSTNPLAADPESPTIEALPGPTLLELMSACAEYRAHDRRVKKGDGTRWVKPPGDVVSAVHARKVYPTRAVRPLLGIIEAPSLRPDWSIITEPGYDASTGLYLRWMGDTLDVPARPTHDDARAAYQLLAGLTCDFSFRGGPKDADVFRVATVAAILSPLARAAIDGPVPMFVYDADKESAGKTLLADTVGIVATGRSLGVRQWTDDDDEALKRLASIALNGPPLVLFDNIKCHVEGSALEAALTAQHTLSARLLGTNSDRDMPWRTVVLATANGLTMSPDMNRRVVHTSLVGRGAHTTGDKSTTFRHPDLRAHARAERRAYLRAALTILRAYDLAGRPDAGNRALESYIAWSRVVGAPLMWASGSDPAAARPPEGADRDRDIGRRVALAWWTAYGDRKMTLADVRADIDESPNRPGASALREALADVADVADLKNAKAGSLGKRFGRLVADREFPMGVGEFVSISRRGENRNGVALFEAMVRGNLSHVGGSSSEPTAGDAGVGVGFYNPRAQDREEENQKGFTRTHEGRTRAGNPCNTPHPPQGDESPPTPPVESFDDFPYDAEAQAEADAIRDEGGSSDA